jgi:hypothetical protein
MVLSAMADLMGLVRNKRCGDIVRVRRWIRMHGGKACIAVV